MSHFQRVAIVNRGEPAMRLINAVREWNAEGRPARGHDAHAHPGRADHDAGLHDEASALRAKLASAWPAVHAEKLGQLADEYDGVHSIERARQVGSVHVIVPAARLRPYLIDAVRRGMARTLAGGRR